MADETRAALYNRLRQEPSRSSVDGSLPVLFFGQLPTAKVATIGLNPSDREYLDAFGRELDGTDRRLETLASLGASSRRALTDEQCDRAVNTMCEYFSPDRPVYGWFRPFGNVLRAMGLMYARGEVAHLDLVQEATQPTWSRLRRTSPVEFVNLRSNDLPFLRWQLESFPIECALCDGRTALEAVIGMLAATTIDEGVLRRVTWSFSRGSISGRTIGVYGWNLTLARGGLGTAGEAQLGSICANLCHP